MQLVFDIEVQQCHECPLKSLSYINIKNINTHYHGVLLHLD